MDIINLTLQDSANVNALLPNHKDLFSRIPNVETYVSRYSMQRMDGTCAMIVMVCKFGHTGLDMDVHEENSILLARKPIPPFHIVASMVDGNFKIVKKPKTAEAMMWLNTRNSMRSNGEELWYVAMHSAVALSSLKPVLLKKETPQGDVYSFPNDFLPIAKKYLAEQMKKEMVERKFNGFDIVNLTFKQYTKMLDIIVANKIVRDIDYFALPKFAVSLYHENRFYHYFYEAKGRKVRCGYSEDSTDKILWFDAELIASNPYTDTIETALLNPESTIPWFRESQTGHEDEKNWEWIVNLFLLVNAFMLHYGDVAMEIEEKQAKGPSESRPQKKRDRNSVRIFKSYHLVKNWTAKARKKAEYTCLAWGVRGHFRHLRNGKTIFVEAYVKGKEKDKYKGKEYNLLPYKDA